MKKIKLIVVVLFCVLFTKISNAQYFEWAKCLGKNGEAISISIIPDKMGNLFITGSFSGTADFDPGTGVHNMTSNGNSDIFVTKLDSLGKLLWVKQIGGLYIDEGHSITVDSFGGVYVTGFFQGGNIDFDPSSGIYSPTAFGYFDIFILKLDAAGNFKWVKSIGSDIEDEGQSICVDPNGNVYIAGVFRDSADFDPGPSTYFLRSTSVLSAYDAFVSKLDSAGNFIWARKMGGALNDGAASVSIDPFGNVIVGGGFKSSAEFNPGSSSYILTSYGASNADAFICKLSSSGTFMWAKQLGGINDDGLFSVNVDQHGNIYSTGNFIGTADFDPGNGTTNLVSNGGMDIFISKLNSAGSLIWARQMGGSSDDNGLSISIDKLGYIYTAGRFQGAGDFDPGFGNYNFNNGGVFLSKLDSLGTFTWARQLGITIGTGVMDPLDMKIDKSNNLYTSGCFEGTQDFDPNTPVYNLTTPGNRYTFVVKLSQDICSRISLLIDSASDVSCSQSGYAAVNVLHPSAPYTFQWNTNPTTINSLAYFSSDGLYTVTYSDTNNCVIPRGVVINGPNSMTDYDLTSDIIDGVFRPGYINQIFLDAFNDGCHVSPSQGRLSLILDSLLTFNYSIPSPDSMSGDTLTWYFDTLSYDSSHIVSMIFVTTMATAQFGDTIFLNTSINPLAGDIDTSNNHKKYYFPIRSSYDPNIKSVYPTGACPEGYILNNQKLTYTIQFQNTGNANAININVLDSLDADLDLNSVRVVAHSHPLITEVLPGNVLKFRFDNIQLPDSGANEPLSHGYVIYEVTPKSGLTDGTQIQNAANIYFDFNPAVNTNSVLNTVVSAIPLCNLTTSISKQSQNESSFRIYPNPANDFFTIENISSSATIKLYDLSGRIVLAQKVSATTNNKCVISTSSLQNGIFLVEVSDEKSGKRSFGRVVVNR